MDFDLGGRNGAPKFPMPNNYQFLLRYAIQAMIFKLLNYVNTIINEYGLWRNLRSSWWWFFKIFSR